MTSKMQIQTVPLVRVAQMLSGGTPSKSDPSYWNGSVPWLTPKDMGRWDGCTEEHVSESAIGNGTRLAPRNAVFIAVRGMSLHSEIRIIRSQEALTFNQDIKALVPTPALDGEFLYYALLSKKPELLDSVEAAGHGTGRLPTDKLEAIRLPDIALKEQRAVASLLSVLDEKILVNRRMNETLEVMARAIFKDWFVDFGPTRAKLEGKPAYLVPKLWAMFPDRLDNEDRPDGWQTVPLDEVADFLNGLALQKFPGNGIDDLPVIKIAELRSGVTANSDWAANSIPPAYIVEDGDILFSWSGSLTQKIWTGGRGALNQHLFKVTSRKFPNWLHYFWVDYHLPGFQAIAASKATTMGHIQRYHLREAETVIGDERVMKAADILIAPMFERLTANDLESRTLAQTRDFLLPRLMSGEIRIKQAEKVLAEVA